MPRYFLALLPPSTISHEIIEFQKEIEQLYGANHAQNAPPHITIIPPFEAEEEALQNLENALHTFFQSTKTSSIDIKIDNFQVFDLRTLFIDVAKNEAFESLCKELKSLFNQQKIIPQRIEKHFFIPHITIANKDLKKRDFKGAWVTFQSRIYQRSFELTQLHLLKYNGKKWQLEKEILI